MAKVFKQMIEMIALKATQYLRQITSDIHSIEHFVEVLRAVLLDFSHLKIEALSLD